MSSESPCLTCGACCANFRVSFYWGECQSAGGSIPDELTLQVSPHHACMKGTEKNPVRCIALVGTPGEHVSCNIYEQRSSTCRDFDIWNDDGSINETCTRARAVYRLPPIVLPEAALVPEPIWVAEVLHADQAILITEPAILAESAFVSTLEPMTDSMGDSISDPILIDPLIATTNIAAKQPELIELLVSADSSSFPTDETQLN